MSPDPVRWAVRAGLLVLLTTGCSAGATAGGTTDDRAAPSRPPSASPVRPDADPSFSSVQEVPERGQVPVRLRIPSLGIDAPVGPVGTAPDGTVEVPQRWEDVGWFDEGARPGDAGPAVLLGHVDSKSGPAVFVRLPQATSGTVVEVVGAAGAIIRYRVDRVESYPKTRFPTDAVYLPALRPELRLVTCGGEFDRRTGHYRDNVVAYASLLA